MLVRPGATVYLVECWYGWMGHEGVWQGVLHVAIELCLAQGKGPAATVL